MSITSAQILSLMKSDFNVYEENRENVFSYVDQKTGRHFTVRRIEIMGDANGSLFGNALFELRPSGCIRCLDNDGRLSHFENDDRILQAEKEHGVNGQVAALIAMNIDVTKLARAGAGLNISTKFYKTLDDCAVEIKKALDNNVRYSSSI